MLKLYHADTSIFEKEGVFDELLGLVNEQRRRKVLRCKNEKDKTKKATKKKDLEKYGI